MKTVSERLFSKILFDCSQPLFFLLEASELVSKAKMHHFHIQEVLIGWYNVSALCLHLHLILTQAFVLFLCSALSWSVMTEPFCLGLPAIPTSKRSHWIWAVARWEFSIVQCDSEAVYMNSWVVFCLCLSTWHLSVSHKVVPVEMPLHWHSVWAWV